MSRLVINPRMVGLCAAIVVLLIIDAGSARAEVGANWLVNGAKLTSTLLPEVGVVEVEKKEAMSLVGKYLTVTVTTSCANAEAIGVKLQTEGKVGEGFKVRFTGCVTYLNGVLAGGCEPRTGAEKGVIVTKALTGSLVLSGKETVVSIQATGGTLATFQWAESCAAPEELQLTVGGSVALRDGALGEKEVNQLFGVGPSTSVTFMGGAATMQGSAILKLLGEHKGASWSGIPG